MACDRIQKTDIYSKVYRLFCKIGHLNLIHQKSISEHFSLKHGLTGLSSFLTSSQIGCLYLHIWHCSFFVLTMYIWISMPMFSCVYFIFFELFVRFVFRQFKVNLVDFCWGILIAKHFCSAKHSFTSSTDKRQLFIINYQFLNFRTNCY